MTFSLSPDNATVQSQRTYAHRCIEGAAVQVYRDHGIGIAPGMKIQYLRDRFPAVPGRTGVVCEVV